MRFSARCFAIKAQMLDFRPVLDRAPAANGSALHRAVTTLPLSRVKNSSGEKDRSQCSPVKRSAECPPDARRRTLA
jgi:hypothetical protein